jgi:hypothetical protein
MAYSSDLTWHERALKSVADGTPYPEIHPNEIHHGFYRWTNKRTGGCVGVMYWKDKNTGKECCQMGSSKSRIVQLDEHEALNRWTWVANHPVTQDQYLQYLQTGRWFDIDEVVQERITIRATSRLEPQSYGHNFPSEEILLMEDITKAVVQADDKYKKIADKNQGDKAQSLRSYINDKVQALQEFREKERVPAYDAYQAVLHKYDPIIKSGQQASKQIVAALTDFSNAQRKAALTADIPKDPPKVLYKGATGRGAGERKVLVIIEIDYFHVMEHYKDHIEVRKVLLALAEQDVAKGNAVPGVTTEERVKVV